MKILILENQRYQVTSKDAPQVGHYYSLAKYEPGTEEQNRAFHALLGAFYNWMMHTNQYIFTDGNVNYDFSVPDAEMFKVQFKYQYGAGAEMLGYYENNRWYYVKSLDKVPLHILQRFNSGEKQLITWKNLKSWRNYTKKQRTKAIENIKRIIAFSGS